MSPIILRSQDKSLDLIIQVNAILSTWGRKNTLSRHGMISVHLHSFPSGPPVRQIRISRADLDRAAASLGDWNSFLPGAPSTVSAAAQQWRVAITHDTVAFSPFPNRWVKTQTYEKLEPTEKGYLSGMLGGTMSKLVAERVFKMTYFGHVEYFRKGARPTVGSKRKPDFLGLSSPAARPAKAVVVESKGRSNQFNDHPDSVANAKSQASSISNVAGYPNLTRYAQFTHFLNSDRSMQISLHDPPAGPQGQAEYISELSLTNYYAAVANIFESYESFPINFAATEFQVLRNHNIGFAIGLPRELYELSLEGEYIPVGGRPIQNQTGTRRAVNQWWVDNQPGGSNATLDYSIGPDGIIFMGSYTSELRQSIHHL